MRFFSKEERKFDGREHVKRALKILFSKKGGSVIISSIMALGNYTAVKTEYGRHNVKPENFSTQEKLSATQTKGFKERIKGYELYSDTSATEKKWIVPERSTVIVNGRQTKNEWTSSDGSVNSFDNVKGSNNNNGTDDFGKINPEDFILATIDFGGNPSLPIFQDRIIETPGLMDTSAEHGVMVASAAVERLNEYPQYSKNIKIMPINFNNYIQDPNCLEKAFDDAMNHGAKVISVSFSPSEINDQDISAYQGIAKRANENNIVLVAAAGNSGHDFPECIPAGIPEFISVGAVDKNKRPTSFTENNENIDLADYGKDVEVYDLDGNKQKMDGTSFSAPEVAADIAMIYKAHMDKGEIVTVNRLKEVVYKTAEDVYKPGKDFATGNGIVNVEEAIKATMPEKDRDVETPNIIGFNVSSSRTNNLERISFKVLDESGLDTKNTKVFISGINDVGEDISEREVKYVRVENQVIVDIKNQPDGEYALKITKLGDSAGNMLDYTKRIFMKDNKSVEVDINYKIVDAINGIDNKAIFDVDVRDNFGVGAISAKLNNSNSGGMLFGISLEGRQDKRVQTTLTIKSSDLEEGQNILSLIFTDTNENVTIKDYLVVKNVDKVVFVESMENDFNNVEGKN